MKVKKGNFIEIEFTGKVKDTNQIFDLTDEKLAKENEIYNPDASYGPIVICVGESDVVKGLDEALENKEVGKKYKIEISAENAFGKKNPKLMKIVSTNIFREKKITPFPGLQVNLDGLIATIRTVSGGRTILDFNHPLAGRDVVYEIKINKIIIDDKEKLRALLKLNLNLKDVDFELKESVAKIKIPVPKILEKKLAEKIKKLIPKIKKIEFEKLKTKKPEQKQKQETKEKQPLENK